MAPRAVGGGGFADAGRVTVMKESETTENTENTQAEMHFISVLSVVSLPSDFRRSSTWGLRPTSKQ